MLWASYRGSCVITALVSVASRTKLTDLFRSRVQLYPSGVDVYNSILVVWMCTTLSKWCGCVQLYPSGVDVYNSILVVWLCTTISKWCGCVQLYPSGVDVYNSILVVWMCTTIS